MLLSISLGEESMDLEIDAALRRDPGPIYPRIEDFLKSRSAEPGVLDITGMLPKLIRGVAGCEDGCPADAKGLVSRGLQGFALEYVEGGILLANSTMPDGRTVSFKLFPDF